MKCLIDMDGVVANFVEGCCALYGKRQEDWPQGQYDFPYQMLGEASEDAVWKRIANLGSDFWRDLSPMTDAYEIVAYCEEFFGRESCAFLTSPPKSSPWAATGKIQWIKRYFPEYNRRTLVGACKEFCAHSNAILIDDYAVQVDKFKKHGGYGVLLPRPWNEEHGLDTMSTLLTRLRPFGGR
jgi:5'(3')-deoxyribonucleotidase